MKKLISLALSLSLAFAAFGQNALDRPMEAFPELSGALPSVQAAKTLMTSPETHLKCQGAWVLLQQRPSQAARLAVKALRSGDRQFANAVLGYADETAGPEALVKAVRKVFPKLDEDARADVLYWIGRNRLTVLQPLVDRSLAPGEAGEAAVFAATQLGGDHNRAQLDALVQSGGALAKEILRLRGAAAQDDDDSTRNSLRDSK